MAGLTGGIASPYRRAARALDSLVSFPVGARRTLRLTVHCLPTIERAIALTFDVGSSADGVHSILTTLAATGVPASFFLTGRWAETYPQLAAGIGARYPVGNHTYSHPDLTKIPDDEVEEQIRSGASVIAAVTGKDPRPLFRAPFGATDRRVVKIVNRMRYGVVRWTVDTLGWKGTSGGQSIDSVIDRVLKVLQPGTIVLMHMGSHPTDHSTLDADALPRLIEEIARRGYAFAPLTPGALWPGLPRRFLRKTGLRLPSEIEA
jgi:peptidoglycan/xylan/chitin deacetylase (PgdA/CDA1 family)